MTISERGSAQITVLLCMAFLFSIISAVTAYSMASYKLSANARSDYQDSYNAESAMSHAIWELTADLSRYRDRRIASAPPGRIMADSRPRTLEIADTQITLTVSDANAGLRIDDNLACSLESACPSGDYDTRHKLRQFAAAYVDYCDQDDLPGPLGAEKDQYPQTDLPRNNAIHTTAELAWLKGYSEIFAILCPKEAKKKLPDIYGLFRPLPYPGANYPRNLAPNFFASSEETIIRQAKLEESEAELVREARRQWFENGIPVRANLPLLYRKLSNHFSFKESGVYRIRVQEPGVRGQKAANSPNKQITDSPKLKTVNPQLEITIDLEHGLPHARSDTFSGLRYWKYRK